MLDTDRAPIAKGKFLQKLDELGKDLTRKMIVLHYDMLGEGIDVKAFTGTVFLRNICSNIKAVQAMGRGDSFFSWQEIWYRDYHSAR